MPNQNLKYLDWLKEYQKSFQVKEPFHSAGAQYAFEALQRSLTELSTYTEYFQTPDDEGNYPLVQEKHIDELIEKFQNVSRDISAFRREANSSTFQKEHIDNSLEKTQAEIFSKLEPLIAGDMQTLITAKSQGGVELPLGEMLWQGKVREVEYSGEIKTVGMAMSQRIPMEITDAKGNPTKGFFTAESSIDIDLHKKLKSVIEKEAAGNDTWKAFFQKMYKYTYENQNPYLVKRFHSIKKLMEGQSDLGDIMGLAMQGFPLTPEEKKLMKDPRFCAAGCRCIAGMAEEKNNVDNLTVRGYNKGNIDRRNSAMTAVANLMGVSDEIAPSYSVKVNINGNIATGTFMGMAKGVDLVHLESNSPLLNEMDGMSLENPEYLKSLSNLQALDFICGNSDRHRLNMFYRYDDSNPPKMIGVHGIDNDFSFCTLYDERTHMVPLDKLGFVTESTAKRIMSMTPGTLSVLLESYGLSKEEIDAANNRFSKLQEKLVEGKMYYADKDIDTFEAGHIKIVKDEDLPKVSLYGSLSGLGHNLFATAADALANAANMDRYHYVGENMRPAFQEVKNNWGNMAGLCDDMIQANKGFFIGSSAYRNALGMMKDVMSVRKESMNKGNSTQVEKYLELLDLENQHIDNYLHSKQGKKITSLREQNRVDVMTSAKAVIAKEKEIATKFYQTLLQAENAPKRTTRRIKEMGIDKQFMQERAKLRQKVRIWREEKHHEVFTKLPQEDKNHPEKNMNYVVVSEADEAYNKLAEMNSLRPKTPEYMATKVNLFATNAIELLWEKEQKPGGDQSLHNYCKDKAKLIEQVRKLAANKDFAKKASGLSINSMMENKDQLVSLAEKVVKANILESKHPAVQNANEPKVENVIENQPKIKM